MIFEHRATADGGANYRGRADHNSPRAPRPATRRSQLATRPPPRRGLGDWTSRPNRTELPRGLRGLDYRHQIDTAPGGLG